MTFIVSVHEAFFFFFFFFFFLTFRLPGWLKHCGALARAAIHHLRPVHPCCG